MAGLAQYAEQHQKQQEENKALASQAKALETLLPSYARKAGVTDEEIQRFLAPNADETPRGRVARLQASIEGIVGQAALQSRQLNDELVRTNTAGAQQTQRIAADDRRDQVAQRGRVRSIYGGQPSPQEIEAMLQTGSRFQDLGPGAPPPDAAAGAQRMLAAGVDDPRLLAAVDRILQNEQFNPRVVDLGNGVTAMMTSPRSAVPINRGTAPKSVPGQGGVKTIELPGVGTMVVDATTGEPIAGNRIVRPPSGGQRLDPMLVGTLTEQIAKLEQEKSEHQQEIAKGDKRTGFLNLSSREARVREIDQQLGGLRATLNAGGKGAAAAPAAAPGAPSSSGGAAQPKAAPIASPYTSAEMQAELRRRGLIQ
jgi:hypothetical protein